MNDIHEFEKEWKVLPHWREDPSTSYSDWTIKIKRSSKEEIYRVHKTFLAVGERKSTYFEGLFKSNMKETTESCTEIQLQPSAAEAFPYFLDFIYVGDLNQSGQVKEKPELAVALRFLADYFGVSHLKEAAYAFLSRHCSLETNIDKYYQETLIYKDDEVAHYCMRSVILYGNDELLRGDKAVTNMATMLSEDQRYLFFFSAYCQKNKREHVRNVERFANEDIETLLDKLDATPTDKES